LTTAPKQKSAPHATGEGPGKATKAPRRPGKKKNPKGRFPPPVSSRPPVTRALAPWEFAETRKGAPRRGLVHAQKPGPHRG